MTADNTSHIVQAAKQRHHDTVEQARAALQRLDRTGAPISFHAVAQAASISRSWLYRDPTMRSEIQRLRADQSASVPAVTVPSGQRATLESLQRRLETAHDDIRRLRDDNTRLRDQVAALLGQRRSGTIDDQQPPPIATIGPRQRHVPDEDTLPPQGFPGGRSR
jgi:hypothetical protein